MSEIVLYFFQKEKDEKMKKYLVLMTMIVTHIFGQSCQQSYSDMDAKMDVVAKAMNASNFTLVESELEDLRKKINATKKKCDVTKHLSYYNGLVAVKKSLINHREIKQTKTPPVKDIPSDEQAFYRRAMMSCKTVFGYKNCSDDMSMEDMKHAIKECRRLYPNPADIKAYCE